VGSGEKDENLQAAYDEANEDFDSIDLDDTLKELRFPDGKLIWKELLQTVHERSIREKLAPGLYRKRLEDVGEILEKINGTFKKARQINAKEWLGDVRDQGIWGHQPEQRLMGAGLTSCNRTFGVDLVKCVAFYLYRPWMQYKGLDWVFLDALIFSRVEALREEIYSGRVEGRIDWAYHQSGGDFERMRWWQLFLVLVKWTLRYPLPLGIIVCLLLFQYMKAALIVTVLYGIYMLIRLAFWPARFRERRKLKEWHNLLHQMVDVYYYCNTPVIHPRTLKVKFDKAQEKAQEAGAFLDPAASALLDGILSHNPSVFMPFDVRE